MKPRINEKSTKCTVIIDTTPLGTASAGRGIGMYTRMLSEALEKLDECSVLHSSTEISPTLPTVQHYPFFDLYFPTLPFLHRWPSVVTIHDVIPLKFPDQYAAGKKGALNFIRQKAALSRVDAIITDSYASKVDIVELLGVPAKKVSVIYLAGNAHMQPVEKSMLKQVKIKYQLPDQYICYVGDINFNKNIPALIKALRYLPEHISLVCVGSAFTPAQIPEWKAIESQVALTDVANRILFLNSIGRDEVTALSAIVQQALCYVQPSLYEGFGLPVLEAQQCGTPVVVAKNSSLAEVGGSDVVYSTETSESLAAGVLTVLNWSAAAREKHTRAGKLWARRFTWDRVAQQTLEVYKTVLKLH